MARIGRELATQKPYGKSHQDHPDPEAHCGDDQRVDLFYRDIDEQKGAAPCHNNGRETEPVS